MRRAWIAACLAGGMMWGCGISDHPPPTAEMPYSYAGGASVTAESQTQHLEQRREAAAVEDLLDAAAEYRRVRGEWPTTWPTLLAFAEEKKLALSGSAFRNVEFSPEPDGSVTVKYQATGKLKPISTNLRLTR